MKTRKSIAILLTALMLLTALPIAASADEVIRITTPQQLQNINNNVAGSYILMNDIDLVGMDFTPIGNADSGAFSGVFDGNGKTIRNLDVFAGKYAGLFGCNEGTIKNVTLENVYVYGTRYIGGVVGENTAVGTVENCSVLSGKVESDGGISAVYGGGVIGINHSCYCCGLSNGADVSISSTTKKAYAGGVVAYSDQEVFFGNCSNNGRIYSYCENGNTIGDSIKSVGSVSGGIIAFSLNAVNIEKSSNHGMIESNSHTGGIIGCANSIINIESCFNTGVVKTGAGIVGYANDTCIIQNCYNTGNFGWSFCYWAQPALSTIDYYSAGGIVGYSKDYRKLTIFDCYNAGFALALRDSVLSSYTGISRTIHGAGSICGCAYEGGVINCYSSLASTASCRAATSVLYSNGVIVDEQMMTKAETYSGWDFENKWMIDPNVNSGLPVLRNNRGSLELNITSISDLVGKSYQLAAYRNGQLISDVVWSVVSGNSSVDNNGRVWLSKGVSMIQAKDSLGNTAVCSINGLLPTMSFVSSSITINRGSSTQPSFYSCLNPLSDSLIWASSDTSVATVDQNGIVSGIDIGSAVITVTAVDGSKAEIAVTVNAPVTAMDFEKKSMTCYKGDTGIIRLIYDPVDTTSSISYSSSSTSTVSVNSSTGEFTAKAVGTATITAKAGDVKATCVITVKSIPTIVTSLTLDQTQKDMLVGEAFRLTHTILPSNATDKTVTWASTDESVATVTNGGTVEAVGAGKALITCESSNGIIAYCTVNVSGVASANLSKIFVPDLTSTEADTVRIPVMIEHNPGISYAALTITYDGGVLEAQSIENGEVFASCMGEVVPGENKVRLYFVSDADITANGALAYINFIVLDHTKDAAIGVGYFPSEIRNTSALRVSVGLRDGKFKRSPICIHTDDDGDGKCDICGAAVAVECVHENTEIRNAIKATCEADGYSGDTYCLDCGEKLATGAAIPATGHAYGGWTVVKAATCAEKGSERRVCANNGSHIETREIAATGQHSDGNNDGVCDVCGTVLSIPEPSTEPTTQPTAQPTTEPATQPPVEPATEPSTAPITQPTTEHTATQPTTVPVEGPGAEATTTPTAADPAPDTTSEPATDAPTQPPVEPVTNPTTPPTANTESEKPSLPEKIFMIPDGRGVASSESTGEIKYSSKAALTKSELVAAIVSFDGAVVTVKDKDGNELSDDAIPGTGSIVTFELNGASITKTVILLGDVDCDGSVNAVDARLALRAAAKLDTLDGASAIAADPDLSNTVNATDARMILRAAAKLDDPSSWLATA